jgi:uncharacterized membrane protein
LDASEQEGDTIAEARSHESSGEDAEFAEDCAAEVIGDAALASIPVAALGYCINAACKAGLRNVVWALIGASARATALGLVASVGTVAFTLHAKATHVDKARTRRACAELGIAHGTDQVLTRREVRRAFRSRAKELHPDKGGRATEFHASQQAYEFLSTKWGTAWAVAEEEERCTQGKFLAAAESSWEDLGELGENCVDADEDWLLVD